MEALEAFGGVGGEAECVVSFAEFEFGVGDFAADESVVAESDGADFAPDLLSDLSFGGSGGDGDGGVVRHEPPDDGECGGVGLAGPVWRLDGDEVVAAEGFEDLQLFLSEVDAEPVGGEPLGSVAPFGAFAGCGGGVHVISFITCVLN